MMMMVEWQISGRVHKHLATCFCPGTMFNISDNHIHKIQCGEAGETRSCGNQRRCAQIDAASRFCTLKAAGFCHFAKVFSET